MPTVALRRPLRSWSALLLTGALTVLAGAVAVSTAPAAHAAQDPVSCSDKIGLVNGGFENPVLPPASVSFLVEAEVPGWRTTATDGAIELWSSGFRGVPSAAGAQFAELNATQSSALYQDLPTVPGTVMRWSLRHRGREGSDTMAVNIGPAGGTLVEQRQMTDGKSAWGTYSGLYTIPPGQTTTRFAFAAVRTSTGNLSVGNFLDDISFGTSACLVASETVTSSTGMPFGQGGDVLTVNVTAVSGGGNPSTGTTVRITIPPGVTYVPGSIRVTGGGSTSSPSDRSRDDVGEYDPVTRTLVVRVGAQANATTGGDLSRSEAATVTYQVRIDPSSSPATYTSQSTVTFVDPLTGSPKTARTNSVDVTLHPVADLTVTLARTSLGDVVAGSPVTYTATLSNNGSPSAVAGQDSAYGTRLTSQLPAALSGLTATTPGGTCTVTGTLLTCDVGVLAKGERRNVELTGPVSPDAPPTARSLVLEVRAGTVSRELVPGDDSASVTDDVTALADVGVTLTATPLPPVAGNDLTYTAVLTNRGPSTARTVTLRDPVPDGTSDPRASVPGGRCSVIPAGLVTGPPAVVECSVPDLAPGARATVTVVVRTAPDRTDPVTNTVTASAATRDEAKADNTATLDSTSSGVADVRAVLTFPTGNVPLGGSTPYELTISNRGPSTAIDTKLAFTAPPGLTMRLPTSPFCTAAAGCTIPKLAPGASVVLRGTAAVAATTVPGRATVTAVATSRTTDPVPADNTSRPVVVLGAPSLEVSVLGAIVDTRRTRGAAAGDLVVWTYVITNTGDVDLTDVVVVTPGTATAVTTTCRPGTLPKGRTAACRVVASEPVTQDAVNRMAVTTTAEVTATWVGGTEVRSSSATGSLGTVLPPATLVVTSTP